MKDEPLCNLHTTEKKGEIYNWATGDIPEEEKDNFEINFFFGAKHNNMGKIESHHWFYRGFGSYVDPQYCQLIDIGTIPLKNSISKIIRHLERNPNIGGIAGEIEVFYPTEKELFDPKKPESRKWHERVMGFCLFYAQFVEYKLSHYFDKAFESGFGFVSVLPGAFSTFRWEAINGEPLWQFFKGLENDKHTAKEANDFLAEDRIMCLEIIIARAAWVLCYLPGAIALTDPPMSIIDLIKQRRRWTNSSLFASWHVLDHFNKISKTGHSCFRKLMFRFLYIYMVLNFVFSQLLVGSLFASYSIFIRSFFDNEEGSQIGAARTLEFVYLISLFFFILMALTKPIERANFVYTFLVLGFGIFIFVSIGFGVHYFWEQAGNEIVAILLAGIVVASYFVPIILNLQCRDICKYIIGIPMIIFLSPMYINVIIIYSMANLHDISWGNRKTDVKKNMETKKNLEQFRATYLIVWIAINIIYGYVIIYISRDKQRFYILILTIIVALNTLIKIACSILHRLWYFGRYTVGGGCAKD